MTLQSKLQEIGTALAAVTTNCYHYRRPKMQAPFLVWTETGEGAELAAGDEKEQQVISGQAAYYTRTEYDVTVDLIQQKLAQLCVGWDLSDVNYDQDTNLIEYLWTFEAACEVEE